MRDKFQYLGGLPVRSEKPFERFKNLIFSKQEAVKKAKISEKVRYYKQITVNSFVKTKKYLCMYTYIHTLQMKYI